ncbi:MAG: FHA domain-containing protein [candidate division KSB1 bacterium]|nr:FHA domain-containing protein [candidate division KSB1 bacterium]MDZ7365202.1 FHA domain-containing protein [candidate division KSB1 bacterium]MDZ7406956.1 FHA domain-containing protein [candidate division KSB1 bacterium]
MNTNHEILADGTFTLKQPVRLPEVLDMLIVGGGPAGTAAAFRAKELGLIALVIDFDDVMKRIRDYAKDKLILPDYGGGDNMPFPRGDGLISLLRFSPIDKDEMCRQWKTLYRENNIPAQVGVELLGLQQRHDGVWQARAYNHHTKAEQSFLTKHVIIAIGRGVPRRFDIPGNTEGIAYRLSDPALYVGAPALVIGGGTSAAEAVIAISQAKIKANDSTAVYWSYRGDKLPKVSKALAEAFFDAYLGNGNIRHYAYSEPVAVITAEDKKEYLSLRTDRRRLEGRPLETSHLEFPKEHCIACIGEDIPTAFLSSLGIEMITAGPGNKPRFVVTPLLETKQPNVFLIGDILSPAYLETENFDADPDSFQEIRRRGNIKAALRDGVLVAEAVAQKLAGKKVVRIDLDFEEERVEAKFAGAKTSIAGSDGSPQKNLSAARFAAQHQAFLVHLISGNVEAEEFAVNQNGTTTIGRKDCDINFPEDMLMSGQHASISHGPEGYFLRDDGSTNGVFIKLKEARPTEIFHGNVIRIGKQMLLFDTENGGYSFIHIDAAGKPLNRYELSNQIIVVGRQAPDVTLDQYDMTLSRHHLSVTVKDRKIWVKDLGSANGSFLKIKNSVPLELDDQFRIGQQLFKFNLKKERARRTIVFNTELKNVRSPKSEARSQRTEDRNQKPEARSQKIEEAKPQAAKLEGMFVVFKNLGKSCSFKTGQTICEIAENNGLKLKADCRIGSCGLDPIRIISGFENMNPLGDEEQGTLEDINKLEPGKYRLACVARPKGPVVVEILEQK